MFILCSSCVHLHVVSSARWLLLQFTTKSSWCSGTRFLLPFTHFRYRKPYRVTGRVLFVCQRTIVRSPYQIVRVAVTLEIRVFVTRASLVVPAGKWWSRIITSFSRVWHPPSKRDAVHHSAGFAVNDWGGSRGEGGRQGGRLRRNLLSNPLL